MNQSIKNLDEAIQQLDRQSIDVMPGSELNELPDKYHKLSVPDQGLSAIHNRALQMVYLRVSVPDQGPLWAVG